MEALRRRIRVATRKARGHLHFTSPSTAEHRAESEQGSCAQNGGPDLPRLPDDVMYEIALYLDKGHLHKLLLLHRSLYEIILPLLWSDIDTRTNVNPEAQINQLNKVLKLKPERALLIKRWVIGMDVIMLTENSKLPTTTASIVVGLAEKKCLVNLTKFWWFWKRGDVETVWTALHQHCPLVKDIGVRRSPDDLVIDPNSSLLKFRDLIGFHLTTHGVYRHHHPNQIRAATGAAIPATLYEMLIHSPRLRELTFDGSCPQQSLWDVWPILNGTWPELRSFSVGMIRDLSKRRVADGETVVMVDFMMRHKNLRILRFLGAAHWANSETVYGMAAHRNLDSFYGRYAQLKVAEDLPSLRTVYLTDLFADSAKYSGILRRFGEITTLGLIVDVQRGMIRSMCQSIFEACPKLVNLDLRLRQGLSSYIDIAEATQRAVHLRSLKLAGAHNLMDNVAISTKGLTIIQKNPCLHSFALYFGDQFTHVGVSGVMLDRYAFGEFTVVRDRLGGRPKSLLVKEVRRGMGTNFAHQYTKEITKDLQPPTELPHTALFSYGEPSPLYLEG